MELTERAIYMLIGGAMGFVAGYIVRYLREIKEKVDKVGEIVERDNRDERGFVRFPIIADIALLAVVVLTVWAAFSSQRASNDVQNTQDRITRITYCNQQFLSKTIKALNERTTYSRDQAAANVELQKAQAEFIRLILHKPPYTAERRERALQEYFQALTSFVMLNAQTEIKADTYPYPTNEELADCLS